MIPKLLRRVFKNWKTSSLGVIGGVIIYTVLENAGCDLSQLDPQAWLAVAIPTIIGVGAVDNDTDSPDEGEPLP